MIPGLLVWTWYCFLLKFLNAMYLIIFKCPERYWPSLTLLTILAVNPVCDQLILNVFEEGPVPDSQQSKVYPLLFRLQFISLQTRHGPLYDDEHSSKVAGSTSFALSLLDFTMKWITTAVDHTLCRHWSRYSFAIIITVIIFGLAVLDL